MSVLLWATKPFTRHFDREGTVVATVRQVITLDQEESDVLHKALHSNGVRNVLEEVRAALSAPLTLPPAAGQKRPTSLTTRVRAGQEITEEIRAQIDDAIGRRRRLLGKLAELVELVDDEDFKAPEITKMIEAHDDAAGTLDQIKTQIAGFTGARQEP
jgi:hypothetical protein